MIKIQTISKISVFVSCLTVIIIFFTLIEMKSQRRDTYKPTIIPAGQQIFAEADSAYAEAIPTSWTSYCQNDNELQIKPLDHFEVILYNIGNGAAKEINIKWKFNISGYYEILSELNKTIPLYKDLKIVNDWLSWSINDSIYGLITLKNDFFTEVDYILPCSIEKTGLRINIPYSYIFFVSSYIQLKYQESLKKDMTNFLIHPIYLNILYYDIVGNRYKNKYRIDLEIIIIGLEKESKTVNFSAWFIPTSK
ncbi:MAG: hypothetical protein KAU01_02120 [Candidatus Cloacimonetes bacterium]|nr:hypothetical protein [Candidatus Cloacimonadota bacterium]